jgi:alpha/beta superfamily hydrolase
MSRPERVLLDGSAGRIEVFVEPRDDAVGIALIAHPHPLYGGTAENKVVTTLARTFRELGYATLRPNFRGVGGSDGEHAHGIGETDDLLAVHAYARQRFGGSAAPLPAQLPVVLAGFSFGAFVITRLAKLLAERNDPAERLVLVGTAAGHFEGIRKYTVEAVAPDTVVIHGAEDSTVPLANVLAWAEPLDLPVTVIPGADHFFHRKLHIIRNIVRSAWHR